MEIISFVGKLFFLLPVQGLLNLFFLRGSNMVKTYFIWFHITPSISWAPYYQSSRKAYEINIKKWKNSITIVKRHLGWRIQIGTYLNPSTRLEKESMWNHYWKWNIKNNIAISYNHGFSISLNIEKEIMNRR